MKFEYTRSSTAPRWAGDFIGADTILPIPAKIDPATIDAEGSVKVIVSAAGAAQNATSIPVTGNLLSGAIPAGAVLRFSSDEFATVNAGGGVAGGASVPVEALVNALESGDTAIYPGTSGRKYVPSGTVFGRTFAERDANAPWGLAADTDDEVYIGIREIYDANKQTDMEFYRPGKVVKENYLPGFSALSAAIKAKIRTTYVTTKGVD
ncbi:MAG: hypothetical protein ABWZ66_11790 [Pyrinomonadaceae bacterium]